MVFLGTSLIKTALALMKVAVQLAKGILVLLVKQQQQQQ